MGRPRSSLMVSNMILCKEGKKFENLLIRGEKKVTKANRETSRFNIIRSLVSQNFNLIKIGSATSKIFSHTAES